MPTKQTFVAAQVLTAAQLNTLQDYVGVVQVKTTAKTDTFTMSSFTFADVTGLSVSITPTSASNKILIVVAMYASSDDRFYARLMRDTTAIGLGDTAGNRIRVTGAVVPGASAYPEGLPLTFIDSPATTSATTYKVQIATTANAYVNRTVTDTDSTSFARGISTITVFEVTP